MMSTLRSQTSDKLYGNERTKIFGLLNYVEYNNVHINSFWTEPPNPKDSNAIPHHRN